MQDDLAEVRRWVALGEDSALEFKALEFSGNRVVGPRRGAMADELAAMANTATGVLALGIDDKSRELIGIPADKLDLVEAWLRDIANDSIEPPLDCVIRRLSVPDSRGKEKLLVRVDVPLSLFVHKSPGGYFRRLGSAKREMRPEALARLFQQRSQARLIRFDEQTVPGTSLGDLNPELWRRFKTPISPKDDQEFLGKLKLIAKDEDGAMRATVSGLLLASDAPEAFLPGAFIQAVCYRGTEQAGAQQLDAKDITGPLDIQIRDACKFVAGNMKVFAVKAPQRIETPQYSLNAVFEAVTNAVAHRDYSIYGSKIRLRMFADRLEIFSPGEIPNTVTIDGIAERQATRNELVTSLLARCPMNYNATGSRRDFIMDKRGNGVPIILAESADLSGKRPEYRIIDKTELKLTIFAAPAPPDVG